MFYLDLGLKNTWYQKNLYKNISAVKTKNEKKSPLILCIIQLLADCPFIVTSARRKFNIFFFTVKLLLSSWYLVAKLLKPRLGLCVELSSTVQIGVTMDSCVTVESLFLENLWIQLAVSQVHVRVTVAWWTKLMQPPSEVEEI